MYYLGVALFANLNLLWLFLFPSPTITSHLIPNNVGISPFHLSLPSLSHFTFFVFIINCNFSFDGKCFENENGKNK